MAGEKVSPLEKRMARRGISEDQISERFIRGSGSGGQKINKTASCVLLRHLPSGIVIKCQATRSRAQNRELARRLLCERLEARRASQQGLRRDEREKKKRSNRPRPPALKEKIRRFKKHRSSVKSLRRRCSPDSD